jgi:hypothetical protein
MHVPPTVTSEVSTFCPSTVHVFLMIFKVKSKYFLNSINWFCLCNVDEVFFLRGRNRIYNPPPLWRYSPSLGLGLLPWNFPFHFGLLDLRHSVGPLGRVISSSQGLYVYTNTNTHTNTKHPCPEWDSNPRSRLPSERRYRNRRIYKYYLY